jgi:hypothetical protein
MKNKIIISSIICFCVVLTGVLAYLYSPVKLSLINDCKESGSYVFSQYKELKADEVENIKPTYLLIKTTQRKPSCFVKIATDYKNGNYSEEIFNVYTYENLVSYYKTSQDKTLSGDKSLLGFYNATLFHVDNKYDHKTRTVTSLSEDGELIVKRSPSRLVYLRMEKLFNSGKY